MIEWTRREVSFFGTAFYFYNLNLVVSLCMYTESRNEKGYVNSQKGFVIRIRGIFEILGKYNRIRYRYCKTVRSNRR